MMVQLDHYYSQEQHELSRPFARENNSRLLNLSVFGPDYRVSSGALSRLFGLSFAADFWQQKSSGFVQLV